MAKRNDSEPHYRERVARVVAAIVSDPTAAHTLEQLATIAHFSPFHFHRIYRGVIGETVAATVRRLRLARAAQLLAAGDESVTQVAMAVGQLLRSRFNTDPLLRAFARPMEQAEVPGGHYVFLAPCSDALKAAATTICTDPPGVDRLAVHEKLNAEIVDFFNRTLSP